MKNVSFFRPIFLGHPEAKAAASKRAAAVWEGTRWGKGGTAKAEAAKLQDAGISLKQCPEKWQISNMTALGRPGLPDDVGPMIAALLSDENRWVNAQRIGVSGGLAL
jgi:NAD(P)-dependent dehydrogenase (short-subunit alcohol dehydrogenase family)